MILKLLKPWVIAAGSSLAAYAFAKRGKSNKDRLRETRLELIEQQRTIDRLRAEIGRERAQRQEIEKKLDIKIKEKTDDKSAEGKI